MLLAAAVALGALAACAEGDGTTLGSGGAVVVPTGGAAGFAPAGASGAGQSSAGGHTSSAGTSAHAGASATGGASAGSGGSVSGGGGASGGGASGIGAASGAATAGIGGGPIGPPALHRIGDTLVVPTIAEAMPKRFADIALDPASDVYLVVHGSSAIGGAFVDADGHAIGAPFRIAETTAWTQAPRAAFAPSAGAFLVAWHDDRDDPNAARVRGRMVRWNGAAPDFASPDTAFSTGASYAEMPPAVAYASKSDLFVVVWHSVPGDDLRALRVTPTGTPVGDEIVVTSDPDWESDAALVYDEERDEMLLAYSYAAAVAEIRVQRLRASDGTLVGPPQTIAQASGTWLPQLAIVPAASRVLAAWFEGSTVARWLDLDGVPTGDPFPFPPGYGTYDGFATARHATLGIIASVAHGTTDEDMAIGLSDAGDLGPVFEATSSPGTDGNFNPRLAPHATRPEWMLVTVRGYAEIVVQRFGL